MPIPQFCSLEDAWGEYYDPKATDSNPIKPLRTLSNKETVNNRNFPQNNSQNRPENIGIYQHPSNMNITNHSNNNNRNNANGRMDHLLYESSTQNYFKDRHEYNPYKEADYKSGCAPRHANPMFPHENQNKVIEPNDRKYFSRTMAPLKDTQGPQNRYFSNPLIKNLRREQKTQQTTPSGLFENGTGGYFPINELGNESNYFTNAMKNLVKQDNTPHVAPYTFNNGAYMNLNQRQNQNTLQNNNVNNSYKTENLMKVNNNNRNNSNTNRKETASNIANTNTIESFSNMETYINYLQKNNDLLRQQVELLKNNILLVFSVKLFIYLFLNLLKLSINLSESNLVYNLNNTVL